VISDLSAAYRRLHHQCAGLGTILFTITELDFGAGVYRRAYSSHPAKYPATGTKPLERDGFFDLCIASKQPFVANTPQGFAAYFTDHALITAMGLGSAVNFPVWGSDGVVRLTVNLLAGEGHFTPDRLASYKRLVDASGLTKA
jgi:hypothetical protein